MNLHPQRSLPVMNCHYSNSVLALIVCLQVARVRVHLICIFENTAIDIDKPHFSDTQTLARQLKLVIYSKLVIITNVFVNITMVQELPNVLNIYLYTICAVYYTVPS